MGETTSAATTILWIMAASLEENTWYCGMRESPPSSGTTERPTFSTTSAVQELETRPPGRKVNVIGPEQSPRPCETPSRIEEPPDQERLTETGVSPSATAKRPTSVAPARSRVAPSGAPMT